MSEDTKDKIAILVLWIAALVSVAFLIVIAITGFMSKPIVGLVFIVVAAIFWIMIWALGRQFR